MGNFYDPNYKEIFREVMWNDRKFDFPKIDIVDNIAFIGIDTMEGIDTENILPFAKGIIGDQQLKKLDILLSFDDVVKTKYKVLYMHHSPFLRNQFLQLKDSKRLKSIIQKHSNIDAMLFGNSHHFSRYDGIWDIGRSYDAGSSTADNVGIRIIKLDKEPEYDYVLDLGCKK